MRFHPVFEVALITILVAVIAVLLKNVASIGLVRVLVLDNELGRVWRCLLIHI